MPRFLSFLLILLLLVPTALQAQEEANSGEIAYVGDDGNIYRFDLATQENIAVTDDAQMGEAPRFYQWPTWASDGQLAFFGSSLDPANPFRMGVFLQAAAGAPVKGVYAAEDEIFTYAGWSPEACGEGCRDLAILYNTQDGLATRLIRADGSYAVSEISQGAPHYWDWAPDGQRMLWSRYGQRYDIFDTATNSITQTLPLTPGIGQSVDWSPIDERLLVAVRDDNVTDLVMVDGVSTEVIAAGFPQGVAYAFSPTANHIAYLDLASGNLTLYDAQTNAVTVDISAEVLAFMWSPDASKIAYITIFDDTDTGPSIKANLANWQAQTTPEPIIQWNVYDLTTDTNLRLAGFFPTEEMIYYFNFFDQFVHSHSLWSPDSRYLVFGEVLAQNMPFVSIVDTDNPGNNPQPLVHGLVGVFSWE